MREQKIAWSSGGLSAVLDDRDRFGRGVANLGDLDGDGVVDLAVGAWQDDDGGVNSGAVWILFMNADGTVRGESKIASGSGGFLGTLGNFDHFGSSLAALGDLDGDGAQELVVASELDDDGGSDTGAVWLLHLDPFGIVQLEQKISATSGGFAGALQAGDRFGRSVARLSDLDGDGVADLAVGADLDDDGGTNRGAVWILFLNADGTVKNQTKISSTQGGFTGVLDDNDGFGAALAPLGDLDGDGVLDLAVGADQDDDGALGAGAVWILFLDTDGTVKSHAKIGAGSGLALDAYDRFGAGLGSAGDLDGDGVVDLAAGAPGDDDGYLNGGLHKGATWILFLDAAGGVKSWSKISATSGNFGGVLTRKDEFGGSMGEFVDFDGDGRLDLAVGADADDEGGTDRGAVWILFLDGVAVTAKNASPFVRCTGGGTYELGHRVSLGGAVSDPDGDVLSYTWSEGGIVLASGVVQAPPSGDGVALPPMTMTTGTDPAADLGLGEHVFLLEVDDGTNAPVEGEARVEVVDTLAPTVTARSSVTSLWPPNHRMVDVVIATQVSDASGGPIVLAASVTSDEDPGPFQGSGPHGGKGWGPHSGSKSGFHSASTSGPKSGSNSGSSSGPDSGPSSCPDEPDYTEPVIDPATGVIQLQLRAERSGNGMGRTYVVQITATDPSGNVGTTSAEIRVEHDHGY